jgi:hypothetical protein
MKVWTGLKRKNPGKTKTAEKRETLKTGVQK